MPLTAEQLLSAQNQNNCWHTQLSAKGKWPTPETFAAAQIFAVFSKTSFAIQVAAYQEKNRLAVDGVVGPLTAGKLRAKPWVCPKGQEYFLIDDKRISVPGVKVIHPSDPDGLEFIPDGRSAWLRTTPIKLFLLHCKGAEGSASNTWAYLKSKHYGVHLSLERDGRVWQYCDLKNVATAHAGKVNNTSIGMEITNAVFPTSPNPFGRPVAREPYTVRNPNDISYGKEIQRRVLELLPAQIEAAVKVITVTCDTLGIPKEIPGHNQKIYTGLLPGFTPLPSDWKKVRGKTTFEGVIGHLHCTNGHSDPTIDVFHSLLDSGFKLREI